MPKVIALVLLCSHVTKKCDWTDVHWAFATVGAGNYQVATITTDYVRDGDGYFIARHICAEPAEDIPE